MQRLYLDCDGVILDTIEKSYKIFEERNIVDEEDKKRFYIETNWDEFILISGEIDNAISKIKELINIYDVKILTHISSKKEGNAKIKYFKEVLPKVEVITVPKNVEKADMIDDPKGAILVDDFYPNLEKWEEKGGIPVKFSKSGKKYNCPTISNLLELISIDFSV